MNRPANTCPATDPNCGAPESIQHDVVTERTVTAIKNILSGDNACGTLIGPNGRINAEHLDRSIRPVLHTYEAEAEMLRADRARISRESEERRHTLELIYSNCLGQLSKDIASRLCHILGYAAP